MFAALDPVLKLMKDSDCDELDIQFTDTPTGAQVRPTPTPTPVRPPIVPTWTRQFGTTASDFVSDAAVDSQENVYAARTAPTRQP